jgi:serine/threonine protein phosphatase PrpC
VAVAFDYVVRVACKGNRGDDRAAVFERDAGLVLALADGAGGTSHGATAAEAVVKSARTLASDADVMSMLEQLDADAARLDGGQTTAIVLVVDDAGLRGASVGDSEAWFVDHDQRINAITRDQVRKPLLGDGARVTALAAQWPGDVTLLVASDGLFRFAKDADIARLAVDADLEAAADALVGLVRLRAGTLADDVSLVLVRRRR